MDQKSWRQLGYVAANKRSCCSSFLFQAETAALCGPAGPAAGRYSFLLSDPEPCQLLQAHPGAERFTLSSVELVSSIAAGKHITRLVLTQATITCPEYDAISPALLAMLSALPKLQHLQLDGIKARSMDLNNILNPQGSQDEHFRLRFDLHPMQQLTQLQLSGKLADSTLQQLASLPKLQHLNLSFDSTQRSPCLNDGPVSPVCTDAALAVVPDLSAVTHLQIHSSADDGAPWLQHLADLSKLNALEMLLVCWPLELWQSPAGSISMPAQLRSLTMHDRRSLKDDEGRKQAGFAAFLPALPQPTQLTSCAGVTCL